MLCAGSRWPGAARGSRAPAPSAARRDADGCSAAASKFLTVVARSAAPGKGAAQTDRGRPARSEQERQRVSPKTPHPQGAQRERVRLYKIPLICPRSRSSPEGPRLQAWCAQRIERVARRAAQKCFSKSDELNIRIPYAFEHAYDRIEVQTASRSLSANIGAV